MREEKEARLFRDRLSDGASVAVLGVLRLQEPWVQVRSPLNQLPAGGEA